MSATSFLNSKTGRIGWENGNADSVGRSGFSFMLFVGIVISFLNLACVGVALWKLDVMRGGRLIYYKM